MSTAVLAMLCVCLAVMRGTHGATLAAYKKLRETLLADYSTSVRPVLDQDYTIFVYTAFYLADLNDVDVVRQNLLTSAYLELEWTDELLQWDAESTGIESLYFKQKEIWTPDLVLKNGVKKFEELGDKFYYLEVKPDGTVVWLPFQVFQSKCDMDVTFFPFDDQICKIIFNSWSFSKYEVNLTLYAGESFDFYNYVENSVWDIVSTGAYESPEASIESEVSFELHLRRKPQHYVMNLILPIILLGVINLLVFLIPADSGEKMSFSVTVFLAFAVFLSIISSELPTNSEKTSLLEIYLIFQLTLGVATIALSSLQLRLHHRRPERKLGRFNRGVITLERFLRCRRCCHKSHTPKDLENIPRPEDTKGKYEWSDLSSAIDFFGFWTVLMFEIGITSVIMLMLSNKVEYN